MTNTIKCRKKAKPTCTCGKPAIRLCDYRIGNGKTCDAGLCPDCGVLDSALGGADLCYAHAKAAKENLNP
jgi:hypothetical protein